MRTNNEVIAEILFEQLGCREDQIKPEASLVVDLGADSLDEMEIVMALEETFDLELSDNDIAAWSTVGDIQRAYAEARQRGIRDMINLHEEHAREKIQAPADWRVFSWEAFPKGNEETLYIQVRGAVCKATFASGKRKGQTNWGRREKATEKTVILPVADHIRFKKEWEARTGLCSECTGEGKVFASWNHLTGTKYKPCPRCKETGKAQPEQPITS